jgi:hypothetical protein
MKTLDDVKQDMSVLYDNLSNRKLDLQTASELANIAGKFLKDESLVLAREMFIADKANKSRMIDSLRDRAKAITHEK